MPRKTVKQDHHISYTPNIVVTMYKGEHWIITQILRRRRFSKGFIKALKVLIALEEDKAFNLT